MRKEITYVRRIERLELLNQDFIEFSAWLSEGEFAPEMAVLARRIRAYLDPKNSHKNEILIALDKVASLANSSDRIMVNPNPISSHTELQTSWDFISQEYYYEQKSKVQKQAGYKVVAKHK